MADKKLRIPGPDEGEDLTRLDNAVFYGLMFCLLVAGLLAVFTKHHASRAEIRAAAKAPPPPKTDLEAKQRTLVDQHGETPEAHEWRGDESIAVLRYGPRKAAEAACRDAFDAGDELPRAVRVELLAIVNRRADHTPWSCLTRAYLRGDTEGEGQLHEEMSAFWASVETFEAAPAITSYVVQAFADEGVPDETRYRDWLYVCAFQASTPGDDCRASLQQLSEAKTLLGVYDRMIRRFDERDRAETAMGLSMEGLSALAKTGELAGWERSEAVSSIDVRVGAVFWMCRLTHSPRTKLAWTASVGLSDVGSLAVRAGDDKLIPRWRQACQLAFRTGGTEDEPDAPALAVWSGDEKDDPLYSLDDTRARGHCAPPTDSAPLWMCGVEAWRGPGEEPLKTELMDFFTETRWIEWRD
jgi:hypothetical protein